jgi:hypothetical protein
MDRVMDRVPSDKVSAMDTLDSFQIMAARIVEQALKHGVDISQLLHASSGMFQKENRWMIFWIKDDCLRYRLTGRISTPPAQIAETRPSFQGIWDEAGTIPNLEQAFELLRAWLLEGKEVDELPDRSVQQWSI